MLPAGADDILCGIIYGLIFFALNGIKPALLHALKYEILAQTKKTTAVSRALLDAAANGWPFPLFDRILVCINDPGARLVSAMGSLAGIGNSSGREMLLGLALSAQLAARVNENHH